MSNPPPVKNKETPTTDTLLARPWVRSSWKYLFRRRQELGVARYGVPLQPFNGRDAILDASEEFQDATVYAEQCIREGRLPVAGGAMLQLLCLFALRVLWHYAGGGTRHRIMGLADTAATEELKADGIRRLGWHYQPDRIEVVLEPREFTAEEKASMLAGTYDPPDSQSDSWGLEPLEDMPTLHLRAVVLSPDEERIRSILAVSEIVSSRTVSAAEAEESNALETEPEPEQEVGTGWGWMANGTVINGFHSWRWQGGSDNRGHSVSKMLAGIWEKRLWEENAAE